MVFVVPRIQQATTTAGYYYGFLISEIVFASPTTIPGQRANCPLLDYDLISQSELYMSGVVKNALLFLLLFPN